MKTVFAKFSLACLVSGIMLVAGCGSEEENTVISGDMSDVKAQIEANKQGYAESMKEAAGKKPGE